MSTIIYYSPHQDDETLWMSVGITRDLYDGHDVHVVNYSTGEKSGARAIINGSTVCSWHGYRHNPVSEGYTDGDLSLTEFSAARNREFQQATTLLGVKCPNCHPISNIPEFTFTLSAVQQVMTSFSNKYPGALHKAQSYTDTLSTDHRMVGSGLLGLVNGASIPSANAFFFIRYEDLGSIAGTTVSPAPQSVEFYKRARDQVYKYFEPTDPQRPSYGVGYHSVASIFDLIGNNPISKYHAANNPPGA